MQGIIHEEPSIWLFLLVTAVMGGWAGWMTARGVALTWRPVWQCVLALMVLGAVVRFFHYALFQEPLLSLGNFIIDYIVVATACAWGYRITRVRQMVEQYPWAYERVGVLWWRRRQELPSYPQG